MKKIQALLSLMALSTLLVGCVHPIAFNPDDTSWHYSIGGEPQKGASLVAVIDEDTLKQSYDFRAWSTGIAHKWVASYGEMLEQVADVEFPQIVEHYEQSKSFQEPTTGEKRLTLVLTVPSYVFEDYRAKMTVQAEAFGPGRKQIFSRTYSSEGGSEAGKMVGLGAFGQKSAVRQSSLAALQDIFAQMRPDIVAALNGPETAAKVTTGN